jgi:hypothetical protein
MLVSWFLSSEQSKTLLCFPQLASELEEGFGGQVTWRAASVEANAGKLEEERSGT